MMMRMMSAVQSLSFSLILLSLCTIRVTVGFQVVTVPLSSSLTTSLTTYGSPPSRSSSRRNSNSLIKLFVAMTTTTPPTLMNDDNHNEQQQQQQQQQNHSRPSSSTYRGHGKITEITSKEEYLKFLEEDDRLCIVKFHAAWCKSCQKMGMQLQRIANELGDLDDNHNSNQHHTAESSSELESSTTTTTTIGTVRFASVEYATNIELCKSLSIQKLPTVLIYSNLNLVDGFPCGPKKIPILLQKIQQYRNLSLEQLEFESSMKQGLELGNDMLQQVVLLEQKQTQQQQTQQQPQSTLNNNNPKQVVVETQHQHQQQQHEEVEQQPTQKRKRRFWIF